MKKIFEVKSIKSDMFAIATVKKVDKERQVFLTYLYVWEGLVREFEGTYNSAKNEIDELAEQCIKWCDTKKYRLMNY